MEVTEEGITMDCRAEGIALPLPSIIENIKFPRILKPLTNVTELREPQPWKELSPIQLIFSYELT